MTGSDAKRTGGGQSKIASTLPRGAQAYTPRSPGNLAGWMGCTPVGFLNAKLDAPYIFLHFFLGVWRKKKKLFLIAVQKEVAWKNAIAQQRQQPMAHARASADFMVGGYRV
jgi:hypothetical protein